jgi:NADPH:quinone reductase-like Zn-dependent oxidoreductase
MRGVNILGVSSTNYPNIKREAIWEKLSYKYKPRNLNIINTKDISLNEIEKYSSKLIAGKMNGRIVIKMH